jgi:hypothetical protein
MIKLMSFISTKRSRPIELYLFIVLFKQFGYRDDYFLVSFLSPSLGNHILIEIIPSTTLVFVTGSNFVKFIKI